MREKLQHREPRRHVPHLPPHHEQELIARMQRRLRSRVDSRRHAALAIERFYRRRRREPWNGRPGSRPLEHPSGVDVFAGENSIT